MDKRYFVLTGAGQSGTMFLANMLNQGKNAIVVHEPFTWSPGRDDSTPIERSWTQGFQSWVQLDAPIVGMSNNSARGFMREIEEAVHPQWNFVWRNPLDCLRSGCPKESLRSTREFLLNPQLRRCAAALFGDLEASVSLAHRLGLQFTHWSFAEYTTPEGLQKLANHLGVELDVDSINWGIDRNATRDRRQLPEPNRWHQDTIRYIEDLIASLPRLSKLYEELQLWPRVSQ